MMLTRDDIVGALSGVVDKDSGIDVVSAGIISGVTVRNGGRVGFLITIAPEERAQKAWLQAACEQAVSKLPGVTGVTAVLTAETSSVDTRRSGSDDLAGERARSASGGSVPPTKRAQWNSEPIAFVHKLVAVASGKGGVGKSTTAVNLAHAFAAQGKRVGLLDADIYGPSIPRMMGLSGAPDARDGKILPPVAHGIKCMSMGLLVGEESALVWRGPQMSKALAQLLRGVEWGIAEAPLDILFIDMPPGTGDVHLSLVQQAPLDGAVIVTTPQDVAVADARKCIDMFHKTHVPILGVIENMSGFMDPASGIIHTIFGSGGGKNLAASVDAPFLGAVPLETALREASDTGTVYKDAAEIYAAIAAKLLK